MIKKQLTITHEEFLELLRQAGKGYWVDLAKLWKLGITLQVEDPYHEWHDVKAYTEARMKTSIIGLVFKEGYETTETYDNCTDDTLRNFINTRDYRLKPEGE